MGYIDRMRAIPTRPRWFWLAVAALLLGQVLGFVHRIVHEQGRAHPPAHASAESAESAPNLHWAARLLGGHDEGTGECLAFDHIAHADLLGCPASVMVAALPRAIAAAGLIASHVPRWKAAFEARGPPPVR